MRKAEGSKTYIVSVLQAGLMNYPDMGYKQYLTEATVNKLTQGLEGLKPLLDHIERGDKIYTKQGQSQIVGVCVKSYNINEPFAIDDKQYRYEDYSACEVIIDDIETINKIEKQGYRPSIHFYRDQVKIDKPSNDIDHVVFNDGSVYKLLNFKVHNIAFVPNPRFDTQVRLSQDNLTDGDRGIINPLFRSQVVNNVQFNNCINSKCMFKKNVKNSDGMMEQIAMLNAKMDKVLSYCDAEQGEEQAENVVNGEPALQEVEGAPKNIAEKQDESVKEGVVVQDPKKAEEVQNQDAVSKEEIAKMIEEGIKKYMDLAKKEGEIKNASETNNETDATNEKMGNEVKNSNPLSNQTISFASFHNPVKEAVTQSQNHQRDNKTMTYGGASFV